MVDPNETTASISRGKTSRVKSSLTKYTTAAALALTVALPGTSFAQDYVIGITEPNIGGGIGIVDITDPDANGVSTCTSDPGPGDGNNTTGSCISSDGLQQIIQDEIEAAGTGAPGDDTVDGDTVVDESLNGDDIEDGSVTGDDIEDGSVTGDDIEDGSVTGDDIEDGSVTGDDIEDGSITGDDLGNDSVGSDELETDSVGSDELQTDSVGSDELQDNSVGANHILEDAINQSHLADNSVGSGEIINGSIQTEDYAVGSVTTEVIANGTILLEDLNTEVTGYIDQGDAQTLSSANAYTDAAVGQVASQLSDQITSVRQGAYEGVALALAADAPHLNPGQTVAISGGYGNYQGEGAFALGGRLRVDDIASVFGKVGITDGGRVGGAIGMSWAW